MPVTQDELEQMYMLVCPTCAAGQVVRQRTDTKEWVHDVVTKTMPGGRLVTTVAHGICGANGLRNSVFAEHAKAQAIVDISVPQPENPDGQ